MVARAANEPREHVVDVSAGRRYLQGLLTVPLGACGVVVFAHGSGSGRCSPRNQSVALYLQEAGFATLLLDLLEPDEEGDRTKVFDVELLAGRLAGAAAWLAEWPETAGLPIGYFGANIGAAAALAAAARQPNLVAAVVSRGGRLDLAGHALADVRAPTLLIVGGEDDLILDLNAQALGTLCCLRDLVVIPQATHLFPEPSALEQAARLAEGWFCRHLVAPAAGAEALE